MKTYLATNPETELGYELICVADNGDVEHHPEWVKELNKDDYFHLDTANPSGREWVAKAKFDRSAINGQMELMPREHRTLGSRKAGTSKTPTPKSSWVDVLTDDERQLYDELKAKAETRLARKAIEDEIAALKAKLEEVEGE